MASKFLLSLDIGSQNIRAAIAELKRSGQVTLHTLLKLPSEGIRSGTVDNLADATHAISVALNQIKGTYKTAPRHILLGVGTQDVKVHASKGVVAVSRADDEIYQDDTTRVIQSAQAINLPNNRMVLHSLIKEFIVDGIENIRDPIGMIGKRLEVNMLIIDAFTPNVKNLTKCVETVGGGLEQVILGPLASSQAVLSKNQKELGVVLIDIGFGKTSLAIYEENQLVHAAVIPIGASHITNDLAIGLRIPIEAAETIKLTFGNALSKEVPARDIIDMLKVHPRAKGTVSKKFIAEIIEGRLAEIFEYVNNEISRVGKKAQLPAGAVLVGGGAKIPDTLELARQELGLSAQMGLPDISLLNPVSGDLNLQAEDPEFACTIGLLLYHLIQSTDRAKKAPNPISGYASRILNYFIP